jgi:hypothetical protein
VRQDNAPRPDIDCAGGWVSHIDRSAWPLELRAEVELAEARMVAAVAAVRSAAVAAVAANVDHRTRPESPTFWRCPVCGSDVTVLYGLTSWERGFACWAADPGYDRPATDPLISALTQPTDIELEESQ